MTKVFEINVGKTKTYLVNNGHAIIYLRAHAFAESDFSDIVLKRLDYPCYPAVPNGLRELMKLTFSLDYYSSIVLDKFQRMWYYLVELLGVNKMPDIVNPPYKALMLFEDLQQANGYGRDVYLYSSTGIKRMTFTEYLHTVEAAHNGNYRLVKVAKTSLSGLDVAHFEALQKMDSPHNGNKLGTIYMCFRALWYAATNETMSTTAWKEEN